MTFQLVILMPVLAGLLWLGLGALLSHVSFGADQNAPRLMWPVLGYATSVVATNSLSRLGITLPWSLGLMAIAAGAGLFLQRRRLRPPGRELLLAAIAAGPVLAAFLGAIVLAGPTITGYLADTNTGVHSLGADYLLHHGGNFGGIKTISTDQAMINRFFSITDYPSGSHAVFGLLGALSGVSLIFVSTPMMGLCLAIAALTMRHVLRSLGVGPWLAAIGGATTTCGALVFSFALASELKEVATFPILVAMTAYAVDDQAFRRPRNLAAAAMLAAALYSTIGLSAVAWAVPFIVLVVARSAWLAPQAKLMHAVRSIGLASIIGIVLISPLLPTLGGQLSAAKDLSANNAALAADPGNLIGPIYKKQALGIWVAADHRYAPSNPGLTSAGMGVAFLFVIVGAVAIIRDRRAWAAVWFAGLIALWFVLTSRGTLWLDSKIVMLSSATLAPLMIKGISVLSPSRKLGESGNEARLLGRSDLLIGALLLTPLLYGIYESDQLLYRDTTTADRARYVELAQIDKTFAGKGPAVYTEFDEYGMYSLRHVHATGPGYSDAPGMNGARYGSSNDLDTIMPAQLKTFGLAITARTPLRSSPGSDWTLALQTPHFRVWQRNPARTAQVIEHVPFGDAGGAGNAKCTTVIRAARLARRSGGNLIARAAAFGPKSVTLTADRFTPNWAAGWSASQSVIGAGRLVIRAPAIARQQPTQLWLVGSVGRPLKVTANGRPLGTLQRYAGGDGNMVGPVTLPAGATSIEISSTHFGLRPGDTAPTVIRSALIAPTTEPQEKTIKPADAAQLCRQPLDWIDVVR